MIATSQRNVRGGALVLLLGVGACQAETDLTESPSGAAVQSADETAPVWPEGAVMQITQAGETHLALRWTPASDDSGRVRYRVSANGLPPLEVDGTSTLLTGLTSGTAVAIDVRAVDGAGNESGGPMVIASTAAACVALRVGRR